MERVASVIERYAEELARTASRRRSRSPRRRRVTQPTARCFSACWSSAGIRPEIISGDREAALSFAGATSGRAGDGPARRRSRRRLDRAGLRRRPRRRRARVRLARSLDIGSRNGSRRCSCTRIRPTRGELAAARTFIDGRAARSTSPDLPSPPGDDIRGRNGDDARGHPSRDGRVRRRHGFRDSLTHA